MLLLTACGPSGTSGFELLLQLLSGGGGADVNSSFLHSWLLLFLNSTLQDIFQDVCFFIFSSSPLLHLLPQCFFFTLYHSHSSFSSSTSLFLALDGAASLEPGLSTLVAVLSFWDLYLLSRTPFWDWYLFSYASQTELAILMVFLRLTRIFWSIPSSNTSRVSFCPNRTLPAAPPRRAPRTPPAGDTVPASTFH